MTAWDQWVTEAHTHGPNVRIMYSVVESDEEAELLQETLQFAELYDDFGFACSIARDCEDEEGAPRMGRVIALAINVLKATEVDIT